MIIDAVEEVFFPVGMLVFVVVYTRWQQLGKAYILVNMVRVKGGAQEVGKHKGFHQTWGKLLDFGFIFDYEK